MVPDTSLSIREGAIAAWPGAWQGANLRSIVSGLGIDVDVPWRSLRAKDREWLLFTDEQPKVLVKPERDRIDHGYYGLFWSARAHVHHVLATSKSQMMRDKAMRFVRSVKCSVCRGTGLREDSLAVTFRGLSIAQTNALSFSDLMALLRPVAELTDAGAATSGADSGGDRSGGADLHRPRGAGPGAARPGAGLPLAGAQLHDSLARRGVAPAHRHPTTLGAFRGRLRSRRAFRGAAPGGRQAAARRARHPEALGQLALHRRARPRHRASSRLGRRYRPGSR